MKARYCLLLALSFFLFCVLADAGTPTGAGRARSVRLNNYNNWVYKADPTLNVENVISILARKDNVIITDSWPEDVPARVKAVNPNTRVYAYYALSIKPGFDVDGPGHGSTHQSCPLSRKIIDANDWWLRDGNGHRVGEGGNSSYFLDVGKPGFKEAYLKALLVRLYGRNLDGVVLDYWTTGLRTSYLAGFLRNKPLPDDYSTDMDWYVKAWQPFIQYVIKGLHAAGYRVIGNSAGEYNSGSAKLDWDRKMLDGVVYEQWAVGFDSKGDWLPASIIDKRINAFNEDPLEAWTGDFGLRPRDPLYNVKRAVSLAMYYIALPDSQEKRSFGYYGPGLQFWDPMWNLDIGTPSHALVRMSDKYFWSRKYTRGIVLLNYDQSPVSYTLHGSYHDYAGTSYSGTVELQPHTALILESTD